MGDGINFPCKYIYKQAGFAEPHSSLTISWVGVGLVFALGLRFCFGLGWVVVGLGFRLGPGRPGMG